MATKDFETFATETLLKISEQIANVQRDVKRLEVLHEETDAKISHIVEVVSPALEQVSDHDIRLRRLEGTT